MVKLEKKWLSGIIAEQTGPVSFNVEVDDKLLHRHADQLHYRECGNSDESEKKTFE